MGVNSSREDNASLSHRSYDSSYGYDYGYGYGYPSQQQQQLQPYYTYDQQLPPPQLHPSGGYPPHPNPLQNSNTNPDQYRHHHSQRPSQFTQPNRRRFQRTFSRIADEYKTLEEVTAALAEAGLESSNLIVGVDFTKSNEWTGRRSYNRLNLHEIGKDMNPYEQAISIIGRTLSSFDEDDLIPCFGFGDASTHDQDVFSFYPDGRPCKGFEEVLSRYREIVPHLKLSGPTSFAPIIEMATTIVEESGGQYHVLLIIADGQVTRSSETAPGHFSLQERQTVDAIVRASEYPLSIVLVGVGDGPWDMMKEFDDHIPQRAFDNFQFVNFTEITMKKTNQMKKETEFALAALMEVPQQYRATLELGILGHRTGRSPERYALPTPNGIYSRNSPSSQTNSKSMSFRSTEATYSTFDSSFSNSSTSSAAFFDDNNQCAVCFNGKKDMAFGCGHQTCHGCGPVLSNCPICRRNIEIRIRLY